MKLSKIAVAEALRMSSGGRVTAMKELRTSGYKFSTTKFLRMADEITAKPPVVVEPVEDEPEYTGPIGTLEAPDQRREIAHGKTFVFTSAQSCTDLNENFWNSLLHYCAAKDAELHVSRYTYNKSSHGSKSIKPGSQESTDNDKVWWDTRIEPYVSDTSLQITPDLVFCGELNILPTRVNPFSTFKNYTRKASGILPHAKMGMESVPTMKADPARFLYSTGTVTARNYIQQAAGQVADFHHVFGALVVEVDDNGTWWARQLNADRDGCFYDLTGHWTPTGPDPQKHRVAALTHGDIHMDKLDQDIAMAVWENDGIVDELMPYEQYFHDTIDFAPRNHHNIKDPHFLHSQHIKGQSSVEREFMDAADFLQYQAHREWAENFIVVSNHDQALGIWLNNTAALLDPENVRFWHEQNLNCYMAREEEVEHHSFSAALSQYFMPEYTAATTFLQEDDSHLLLGEIETGLHGHLGPNGARGSPKNLRTVGKANTGHTHSAGIVEGVYTCGVYGNLDMGYNKGLSSWSHSMTVTYPNAKRAILTIKDGKAWR